MLKTENILRVVCGAYQENAYLVCPEGRKDAFVVDPGDDVAALRRAIETMGRTLSAILLTHGHFDHMLGAQPLQELTSAPIYIAEADAEMLSDADKCGFDPVVVKESMPEEPELTFYGDTLEICGLTLKVIPTPGHSKGSVCLYEEASGLMFTGDTLFCAGYGRTDLHGGSMRELVASLRGLFAMPGGITVLPGHGGASTIATECGRYGL